MTLCAADTLHVSLAVRALEICLSHCEFGDAILFSDRPVQGNFRFVAIPKLTSIADYSRFCLQDLSIMTKTAFVLVVQWDGYVTEPSAWQPRFRKFDYIGAVWHIAGKHRVGNGGFSLRSRRLLAATRQLPQMPHLGEDQIIGITCRALLERTFGIRYAPEKVAQQFSYEHHAGHATFGFHGLPNFWRHCSDDELAQVVGKLRPVDLKSWNFVQLTIECFLNRRIDLAQLFYAQIRPSLSPVVLRDAIRATFRSDVGAFEAAAVALEANYVATVRR